MITTIEIMAITLLVLVVIYLLWAYFVSYKYKRYQDDYKYTRGMNVIGAGSKITLKCDNGKRIKVDKATQICSVPTEQNFEGAGDLDLEPFSSGINSSVQYGMFDPVTTVSLVDAVAKECDGKEVCEYTFNPTDFIDGKQCPEQNIQMIGTYVCQME